LLRVLRESLKEEVEVLGAGILVPSCGEIVVDVVEEIDEFGGHDFGLFMTA